MSRHECFRLNGAVVHGDPNMPQEARDALAAVIDAAREQFGEPTPEQVARYEAGQQRIRERNARLGRGERLVTVVRVEARDTDGTVRELGEATTEEAVKTATDWLTPRCYSPNQAIGVANLLHVLPVGTWSPGPDAAVAVRLAYGSLL